MVSHSKNIRRSYNSTTNNPILQNGERTQNRHFFRIGIQLANRNAEKVSSIISYQGNTNGNHSEILLSTQQDGCNKKIKINFFKKTENNKCCLRCGEVGILIYSTGNVKQCNHCEKRLVPQKVIHGIIIQSSNSIIRYISKRTEKKYSNTCSQIFQFSSVTQSCLTLCNPMNCSTPGLPVHHQLPESTQTHVHRVSDAIQLSHPLSSPSPPAPNPSQHQSLF